MGSLSGDKIGDSGTQPEIQPMTKELVQNLKEAIQRTDITDQQYRDALVECDMDPNEAALRLLAQDVDTFHEVKSKRARRKEMKEAVDSSTRHNNVDLSCGDKISSEHNLYGGSTQGTSNELGKAAEKGQDGSVCPSVTSSMTCVTGSNMASDSFGADNRQQSSLGKHPQDAITHHSSRPQPPLLGVNKGHRSKADIVRMGEPPQDAISEAPGHSASIKPESSLSSHHNDQNQEQFSLQNHQWPELHASKLSALSNANVPSDHFNPQSYKDSLLRSCVSDKAQVPLQDIARDNIDPDKIDSGFPPSRHPTVNDTGLASASNYNLCNTGSSYSHSSDDYQRDVSSAASEIKQLNLREPKPGVLSIKDKSALQAQNSGSDSTSSASLASHASNSGLEVKAEVGYASNSGSDSTSSASLAQNLDASTSVYNGDKLLEIKLPGIEVFEEAEIDRSYDFPSSFQPELGKRTSPEATMSSINDPIIQNSQQMSNGRPFNKPCYQTGNVSTFSRETIQIGFSIIVGSSSWWSRDLLWYGLSDGVIS